MKKAVSILLIVAGIAIMLGAVIGQAEREKIAKQRQAIASTDSALVHQLSKGRTPERVLAIVDSLLEDQEAYEPAR